MANEIKKYASLENLQTFKENTDSLYATKTELEELAVNVAYINTTDNETITDTETSSSSVTVDSYLSTVSTNPVQNKVVTKKINEISQAVEENAKAIEENAKIDVTAELGQTIVVKEVDADGKPTAWEAAEYQPRTHWTERGAKELLPETTMEISEDGQGMVVVDFVLEAGKAYIIKYNGVEYVGCKCINAGIGVGCGNLGAVDESFPVTEHPFILVSAEDDIDGDGNLDKAIAVMPLDGSTTVTLLIAEKSEIIHKLDGKYLPNGLPYIETDLTEILPETTIAIDSENGGGFYEKAIGLVVGNNYTVTWNGTEYNCIAQDYQPESGMEAIGITLGNMSSVTGGEDTGEPFVILELYPDYAEAQGFLVGIVAFDGSESAVLSITGEGEIIHKINNKYLPDGVGYEETVTLLPSMTISRTESESYFSINSSIQFTEGDTYIVTWNGTKYTCTATKYYNSFICIGNGDKLAENGGDTGEPFAIASLDSGIAVFSFDNLTIVTVSIDHANIHKIPLRYLPETLPTVTTEDNGAFLRVVDGNWAVTHIPNVEDGEF